MRNNVVFRYPAPFVPVSDEEGILSVRGAGWFVSLLQQINVLKICDHLCQEDWGVVIFAERRDKRFWIGLNMWDMEGAWLAHFHHHSFALLQRLTASGKGELKLLISDYYHVLTTAPKISDVTWYEESEMRKAGRRGFSTPYSV